MKNLQGKTAVITGAAGGLGSALASSMADKGCHLALIDSNQAALSELIKRLEYPHLRISSHIINLCEQTDIDSLPAAIASVHNSIDILINNAGMTIQKSVENHSIDDWQRVFNLNFWAPVSLCKTLLPLLRQQRSAHIVNLSSMAAFYGLPSQSSYSSSKAALQAYSESLAAELNRDGIVISCIHPGAIKTDMMMATLNESDDLKQAQKTWLCNNALASQQRLSPSGLSAQFKVTHPV
ncbi:Putative oxidoreductase SadH [Zhongshania aliphaticivorans]|uniref:Oxidoreductase SadH n=1 Tax=Zhongshania aliphaticivorans TaxID=1470434 RepID=A0A5S9PZM0_9GAMM|nr:SDR family oxidoreductase [Zhongshania aliphaticivorans]CAA0110653.1 Putative oxidoreductase SadH [Zhongshania aliphaticivorans]CAA0118234.1 Putative oxidoreductase SadH [Zhongshania aliphaticivorans]CAA0122252.1 Putative oxidoreductase SadH [Zhongshania aliphaticivorans]